MTKLIIITLVAVAAVVAWVWFRRRPGLEKPLAHDRRFDEQPPSEDAPASQRTDVGLRPPVTTRERQEQSTETSHEPTTERTESSASPPIGRLQRGEPVPAAEAPESEPFVPQTTPAPCVDAIRAGETATERGSADKKAVELPAPAATMAGPPTITSSSGDEAQSATCEGTEPPLADDEPLPKARSFTEPKPSPTTTTSRNQRNPDAKPGQMPVCRFASSLCLGVGGQ